MHETEQALELAKQATAKIMELCDSCQIFLTVYDAETGATKHVTHGAGNWFSREGHVREWVLQNEERSRAEVHEDSD